MITFDQAVKTKTRNNAAGTDKDLPDLGSLDAKSMTSATALSGTTGVDSKLIHGDRWQEIKGNLTENIEKNLKTKIDENETWTVHENLNYTIEGKTYDNRKEDVFEWFHKTSRFEYFEAHTDHHHEQDHTINPTNTFEVLHFEGQSKWLELALKAANIEVKGTHVEATVAKAEARGAGAEAWGWVVAAGQFKNEVCAIDVGEKELKAELKGMHGKIAALNAQVGGPRTLIMPVRIGLCIALHIDSPWA